MKKLLVLVTCALFAFVSMDAAQHELRARVKNTASALRALPSRAASSDLVTRAKAAGHSAAQRAGTMYKEYVSDPM